jgi:hypothetical protein
MQLTQAARRGLFLDMAINNHYHEKQVTSSMLNCHQAACTVECAHQTYAKECYQQLHDPAEAMVAPARKAGSKSGHASIALAASPYTDKGKALSSL